MTALQQFMTLAPAYRHPKLASLALAPIGSARRQSASVIVKLVVAFAVTALVSVALIATKRFHGCFSMDGLDGVQKLHIEQTPHIGGVAIVVGLVAAWTLSEPDVHLLLGPMVLGAIPAFAFGLAEDCTKKVSVLARLLATIFSGVLAWYITGVAMQNTGVPPLDWLPSFMPFAVLVTAFAVGGVANAINIIDGFNGLASGSLAIRQDISW